MSRAEALNTFLNETPIVKTLGMHCDILGDEMTGVLPFQPQLIGNSALQALHGGAISTFLELTAMAQVFLVTELERPPKPINITVDYLRQGKPLDLYARAHITKMGRRMASVRAEAWQGERGRPVATLLAHFLVTQDA